MCLVNKGKIREKICLKKSLVSIITVGKMTRQFTRLHLGFVCVLFTHLTISSLKLWRGIRNSDRQHPIIIKILRFTIPITAKVANANDKSLTDLFMLIKTRLKVNSVLDRQPILFNKISPNLYKSVDLTNSHSWRTSWKSDSKATIITSILVKKNQVFNEYSLFTN